MALSLVDVELQTHISHAEVYTSRAWV